MKLKSIFKAAKFIGLCCFFLLPLRFNAQVDSAAANQIDPIIELIDVIYIEYPAEGFHNGLPMRRTPGTIGKLEKAAFNESDQTSLQNSLNRIAGVSMESRGYGGSQRINIRGSFLRSPFAVRNVKIYVDGIPVSSPDGTAPLEVFDAFDLYSVEVVKGPAGSLWGSGTGGVMLMRLNKRNSYNDHGLHSQFLFGANGLRRFSNAVHFTHGKWTTRISHIFQENDGFRLQEFNRKQIATINGTFERSDARKWHYLLSYFNGHLGLPGALTQTQVDADPTQANTYSIDNNASLYRERLFAGLSFENIKGDRLKSMSSIYGSWTDKTNPYGTSASYSRNGYKEEGAIGAGGRTEWDYRLIQNANIDLKLHVGYELQLEHFKTKEFVNDGGRPGDFKYSYDVQYQSHLGYITADITLRNLFLTLGTSYNKMSHDVQALGANNLKIDSTASWEGVFLPRLAASYRLFNQTFFHASMSYGNSNPTVFEQVEIQQYNSSTAFSESNGLKPEHGVNNEVGIKTMLRSLGLYAEFNVYQFILKDAILPYTQTAFFAPSGTEEEFTLYSNAGQVDQRGAEASIQWKKELSRIKTNLEVWTAGQWTKYRFDEYVVSGENQQGRYVPGMPIATVSSGISLSGFDEVWKVALQDYYVDRTPLNNANTDWSSAYHLMNARAEWSVLTRNRGPHWPIQFTVFAGVNNVLDTEYTSFLQTNAVAGRYYNPAPGRNYFAGISVKI